MMPIDIRGKQYWTVAERLTLANGKDFVPPEGIVKVFTEVLQVGQITVVKATVIFAGGMVASGHAMVNVDSRQRVEASAPLETAETSAVGRALAFAGYFGSPEGIAGAEEIQLAQERESRRSQGVIQQPQTQFFPDESSSITRQSAGGGSGAAPRPAGGPGGGGVAGGASPAQVRFATKLWGEAGRPLPPPNFTAMNGPMISRLIDELKQEAAR
jgi:hypothetical protein